MKFSIKDTFSRASKFQKEKKRRKETQERKELEEALLAAEYFVTRLVKEAEVGSIPLSDGSINLPLGEILGPMVELDWRTGSIRSDAQKIFRTVKKKLDKKLLGFYWMEYTHRTTTTFLALRSSPGSDKFVFAPLWYVHFLLAANGLAVNLEDGTTSRKIAWPYRLVRRIVRRRAYHYDRGYFLGCSYDSSNVVWSGWFHLLKYPFLVAFSLFALATC